MLFTDSKPDEENDNLGLPVIAFDKKFWCLILSVINFLKILAIVGLCGWRQNWHNSVSSW